MMGAVSVPALVNTWLMPRARSVTMSSWALVCINGLALSDDRVAQLAQVRVFDLHLIPRCQRAVSQLISRCLLRGGDQDDVAWLE